MSDTQPLATTSPPASQTLWMNVLFLAGIHLAAIGGGLLYFNYQGLAWTNLWFVVVGVALTTFAISTGYHRLFSHRTYETSAALRLPLLLLAAAAFQNSALEWASKHRRHHRHTDTPDDPYDATRGLWYSHVGWVLEKGADESLDAPDLNADPLVRWQHRFYVPLAIGMGFGLPAFIGWSVGDVWGGLLFGGLWRLVVSYHMTFSINSLAHWLGTQPYSRKGTARDSWLTALLTMGEGYHNYHHTFPGDYRNGVRFYDFDPPKWALAVFARLGWVRNLQRTPGHLIALRRVRTDRDYLKELSLSHAHKKRLEHGAQALQYALRSWAETVKSHGADAKQQLRGQRRAFWDSYREWKRLTRQVTAP